MTPEQLKNKTTSELLEIFGSKARCVYPSAQNIAKKVYRELKTRIAADNLKPLDIARNHFYLGEGAADLDEQVTKLIIFSKEIEQSKLI